MREWLVLVAENAIVIIDALALVIVIGGTIEACVCCCRPRRASRGAMSDCATRGGWSPA
jgi:hypothetical protein